MRECNYGACDPLGHAELEKSLRGKLHNLPNISGYNHVATCPLAKPVWVVPDYNGTAAGRRSRAKLNANLRRLTKEREFHRTNGEEVDPQ